MTAGFFWSVAVVVVVIKPPKLFETRSVICLNAELAVRRDSDLSPCVKTASRDRQRFDTTCKLKNDGEKNYQESSLVGYFRDSTSSFSVASSDFPPYLT